MLVAPVSSPRPSLPPTRCSFPTRSLQLCFSPVPSASLCVLLQTPPAAASGGKLFNYLIRCSSVLPLAGRRRLFLCTGCSQLRFLKFFFWGDKGEQVRQVIGIHAHVPFLIVCFGVEGAAACFTNEGVSICLAFFSFVPLPMSSFQIQRSPCFSASVTQKALCNYRRTGYTQFSLCQRPDTSSQRSLVSQTSAFPPAEVELSVFPQVVPCCPGAPGR